MYLRSHALKLRSVHEAILKNSLDNLRAPARLRHQHHVLRLHVSGKLRIWLGRYVAGFQTVWTANFERSRVYFFYHHTDRPQFLNHTGQMIRTAVFDFELSLRQTSRDDEGTTRNQRLPSGSFD